MTLFARNKMPNEQAVLAALACVPDEAAGADVVSAGMISGIALRGGRVSFVITVAPQDKGRMEALREACEREVRALPGVEAVTAVLTAQAESPPPAERRPAIWNRTPLENVKRVIAVASGKGGVGKSTTAVGLAYAAQALGLRAGLLDADIYGPSLPRMLGISGQAQPAIRDGKMVPPAAHGVQCMSMAFITGDAPAVLRGPMISKTLNQLLRATAWGEAGAPLDILIVDMPPGTGDVHLSLSQQAPLAGAVIVTTPQAVAVADARKALQMFRKVEVPVLGVVENMSGEVFGRGGGARLAEEQGVAFLGEVALDAAIREAGDAGRMVELPVYREIVQRIVP